MKDKYGFTPDGAKDAFGHPKGWKDGKYVIKFGENDYEEVKTATQQWNDIWGYHPKEEKQASAGPATGAYDDMVDNITNMIGEGLLDACKMTLITCGKIIFLLFKGLKKLVMVLLSKRKKK